LAAHVVAQALGRGKLVGASRVHAVHRIHDVADRHAVHVGPHAAGGGKSHSPMVVDLCGTACSAQAAGERCGLWRAMWYALRWNWCTARSPYSCRYASSAASFAAARALRSAWPMRSGNFKTADMARLPPLRDWRACTRAGCVGTP